MAKNRLRHFGRNAQPKQRGRKPAPECVPAVPLVAKHGPNFTTAQIIQMQDEAQNPSVSGNREGGVPEVTGYPTPV
jgi:hypothetical protein